MLGIYYGRRKIKELIELSNSVSDSDSMKYVLGSNFDLRDIVKNESKRLALLDFLILDIPSLKDKEINYVLSNLISIRYLLKGRIILVLEELEDNYIDLLLENNIDNLILISKNSVKSDIAKDFYRAFSDEGISFLRRRYNEKEISKNDIFTRLKDKSLLNKLIEKEQKDNEKAKTIKNLRTISKVPVNIGFSSLRHSSGTTYLAIQLASFLQKRGIKVCYVEENTNKDMIDILETYNAKFSYNYYSLNNIDFYVNDIVNEDYEVIITDYGLFNENSAFKFTLSDISILVNSFSPKRVSELSPMLKAIKQSDIRLVSYQVDKVLKDYIKCVYEDIEPIYFDREENLFDYTKNLEPWLKILSPHFKEEILGESWFTYNML